MASAHTLSLPEHIRVNIGLFLGTCVQLLLKQRLDDTAARGSLAAAPGEDSRTLNSKGLIHDRASSSGELQVCNSPATGRSVGGGRHGAKGRSRGLFEEGAHALGLSQERFHDGLEIWVLGRVLKLKVKGEMGEDGRPKTSVRFQLLSSKSGDDDQLNAPPLLRTLRTVLCWIRCWWLESHLLFGLLQLEICLPHFRMPYLPFLSVPYLICSYFLCSYVPV
jgi:hypothetical protein